MIEPASHRAASLGVPESLSGTESASRASSQLRAGLSISWASQLFQIASGFIVPRLIEQQLGRNLLGVWDLGWSLTSYFMLLEAGIGSSVNRHIALHLATNDIEAINRVVSSVALVQRVMGSLIICSCLALAFFISDVTPGLSSHELLQAQWLVIILGSAIGISLYGAVYTGVLAGYGRWSLHHGIYAATNSLSVAGIALALLSGRGLVTIALIHWSSEVAGRVARTVAAYRVCPGLSNRLGHARSQTVREMFSYGSKLYVAQMSQVVMNQTVNVMIAASLGPGMLALYTRPRSLVRQAAVFTQKYAFMLVPGAAALANANRADQCRYAIRSTRAGLLICLPLTTVLALFGGHLLRIWMGDDFANHSLIAVLALGFLFEIAYQPLNSVLAGLNHHGGTALISMAGAGAALAACGLVLHFGERHLATIALTLAVPWMLAHGVGVPMLACARLGVPTGQFLTEAWIPPLRWVAPFALALTLGNVGYRYWGTGALLLSLIVGVGLLAATYRRLSADTLVFTA